jgi:hypothetical protein
MSSDGLDLEYIAAELDKLIDEQFGEQAERRRFIKQSRKLSLKDQHLIHSVLTESISSEVLRDRYQSIDDPIRIGHTLLLLETEIRRTKNKVLLSLLCEIFEEPTFISTMSKVRYHYWEMDVLENRNLPERCIRSIWNHNRDELLQIQEYNLPARSVARARNCPSDILQEALTIKDPSVRGYIARHSNIDDEIIHFFVNSQRKSERIEFARSRFAPSEALLSLMQDKFDDVINTAKRNINKRYPDIKITKPVIDKAVKQWVEKPYVKPANQKRKFDMYTDARMGVDHALSLKPSQRASVAKIADEDILVALSNDKSVSVRRSVAARFNCPAEILSRYLKESDLKLVNNALLSFAKQNSDVTFEELVSKEVVESSYKILNTCLNDKSSLKLILEKIDSKTEAEFERANIVAQYSENSMIQMRIVNGLEKIPSSSTLRWKLLSSLSDSHHLTSFVIRKIALELGFGIEKVLLKCKDKSVIREYLSRDRVPAGVRGRLQNYLDSL